MEKPVDVAGAVADKIAQPAADCCRRSSSMDLCVLKDFNICCLNKIVIG